MSPAACIKICARTSLTLFCSTALSLDNRSVSNSSFNWRQSVGATETLRIFILDLLSNCGLCWGDLVQVDINQESLQLEQRGPIHPRRTKRHCGARQWIEHPARHHHDSTRRDLHPDIPTVGPFLDLPDADLAAKTGMPAVVNV